MLKQDMNYLYLFEQQNDHNGIFEQILSMLNLLWLIQNIQQQITNKMRVAQNRERRPFFYQGPYNPEHDQPIPHTHQPLHLKTDPYPTNKRTITTKNSTQNRQHQSTAHLQEHKNDICNDFSSHFTQNLREKNTRIRSYSKNRAQTENADESKGNEQFGKITMHCLRKRRQIFEQDAHMLESEYTYLLKKIQKMQKDKDVSQDKARRHHLIQSKRKRELSSLQIIKASNDSLIMQRKEQLKDKVISHRALKAQNVMRTREEKLRSGQEQRLREEQLHQELSYMQESRFQQNKIKYEREKVAKLRRQRKMKNQVEGKRNMAKDNFKSRWMEEYQKQEMAKEQFKAKKEQFQRKIREAIEIYKQIQGQ